jgi:hypothetical protein
MYREWYHRKTGQHATGNGGWPKLGAYVEEEAMKIEHDFFQAASKAVFKQIPPRDVEFAFIVSAVDFPTTAPSCNDNLEEYLF